MLSCQFVRLLCKLLEGYMVRILNGIFCPGSRSVFSNMCCILIKISITTVIQIQVVRTNFFLSTFSPWRLEGRDTNYKNLY